MFALLGKDPFEALYAFFVEPLLEVWSLHELAIKAATADPDRASACRSVIRSNNWNIGAEGQFIIGGDCRLVPAGACSPSGIRRWCCR